MMYRLLHLLFSPLIKSLWLGKIEGYENLNVKRPFIVVSNHNSYVDFFLIFAITNFRISFLAAEKFFKNFFWLFIMKATGQIKVNRYENDKDMVYRSVDILFRKDGVLGIFPEGTRSRTGKIQKGFNGAVKFANKYDVPILPIGITNTFKAWPPNKKFPRLIKCDVFIGKPIFVNSDNYDEETRVLMINIANLINEEYYF